MGEGLIQGGGELAKAMDALAVAQGLGRSRQDEREGMKARAVLLPSQAYLPPPHLRHGRP